MTLAVTLLLKIAGAASRGHGLGPSCGRNRTCCCDCCHLHCSASALGGFAPDGRDRPGFVAVVVSDVLTTLFIPRLLLAHVTLGRTPRKKGTRSATKGECKAVVVVVVIVVVVVVVVVAVVVAVVLAKEVGVPFTTTTTTTITTTTYNNSVEVVVVVVVLLLLLLLRQYNY